MSNPDEIRREIERTRADLSENVNALSDSAKPSNIAREKVEQVKGSAQNLKEKIFGSDDDPYDSGRVGDAQAGLDDAKNRAQGAVEDAKYRAQNAVGDAQAAIQDAPRQLKRKTGGNPLAAGLVALGLGALVGGLIPVTNAEKRYASNLKDKAQPLADEVKAMAQEAGDRLQPAAQEAVQSVKESATQATQSVKAEAVDAKDTVAEQAKAAAGTVKDDAQAKAQETTSEAKHAASDVKGHAQGAASDVKDTAQDVRKNN